MHSKERIKKRIKETKRRVQLLLFSLLLFLCSSAFAQTAERVEALLNAKTVSYEQAAAFVLEAAEIYPTPASAFNYVIEQKWLSSNVKGTDEARLDALSLLIMKAFELKGGALYSLFQNPHYAYRELQSRDFIEGKTAPSTPVSGELLLFVINRTLAHKESL